MIDRSRLMRGLCALTLCAVLAACGGGGSSSSSNPSGNSGGHAPVGGTPSTPETIQGVATPSSVAVVTATNAN